MDDPFKSHLGKRLKDLHDKLRNEMLFNDPPDRAETEQDMEILRAIQTLEKAGYSVTRPN